MYGDRKNILNQILAYATKHRRLALVLHTLVVFAGCLLLYGCLRGMEDQRLKLKFRTRCDRVASVLSDTLDEYQDVVQSVASFHAGNPGFSADEFRSFVARAVRRYPNIQALEWIPKVDADDRLGFEQATRSRFRDDFRIRKWTDAGLWVASDEDWAEAYYPVLFTEPEAENQGAVGIDLGSNPIGRNALEDAAATGLPIATPEVRLAQAEDEKTGFLLFVPAFQDSPDDPSLSKPRQVLAGYALGVFRIREIMRETLEQSGGSPFHLTVSESSGLVLYDSQQGLASDAARVPERYSLTSLYYFGGRSWKLQFSSREQWLASRQTSLGLPVFVGGVILAILLGSLLWTFTERTAHIEETVSRRTRELEAANELIREHRDRLRSGQHVLKESNQQLREFAYAASHDLQTPLRGIANYAQFLKEDYSTVLDEDGNQHLDGILVSADRMKQLILHLLEYSQVESQKDSLQSTDLNRVVDDVLLLLHTEIQLAEAEITSDELPTIVCDPKQMAQLFRNLMTNALKYRSERPLKVHISVRKTDVLAISVDDNGIGIDSEYHSKIFDIFRRLHTQSEYPGTGIGLALCRRIAQRHGGTISVDSVAGEGCRFTFTIPVQETASSLSGSPETTVPASDRVHQPHISFQQQAEKNCPPLAAHS